MMTDDALTTAAVHEMEEQAGLAADIVHAMAVSPDFAVDGLCLSARDSGLWLSRDGGAAWQPAPIDAADEPRLTVTTIAFSPHFAGDRTIFAGAHGAIFRSIDAGHRWRIVPLPAPSPLVTCLTVSPAYEEDGVVLAGTLEDGVLRSDDRGDHWKRWNFSLLDLSVYALTASPAFGEDETLFAGTETAVFKSENGGRSWRETAFPEAAAPVLALAIDRRGLLWSGTDQEGVWRSADGGADWQRADGGEIDDAVNGLVLVEDDVLAVLPEAVLISRDDGRRWQAVTSGLSDEGGIAGVAAPWGLDDTATLLVQLRGGSVRRIRIGGGHR